MSSVNRYIPAILCNLVSIPDYISKGNALQLLLVSQFLLCFLTMTRCLQSTKCHLEAAVFIKAAVKKC